MKARRHGALRGAAVVAAALVAAACSHDGTTLRAPAPGATAPVLATVPSTTSAQAVIAPASPDALVVASSAFANGDPLPAAFTCDGADQSPPLSWTGVPVDAAEVAVVVSDQDANDFVHWVVSGLSPDVTALPAGTVPAGAVQLQNDSGSLGWYGPCPPKGSGVHHYVFTVYALANPLNLVAGSNGRTGATQIVDASIEAATLMATYQRP